MDKGMAARMNRRHQDEVRAKIQASQLINRLQNHALGNDESEISPSRMKAIEILLRKSLPDLSSVELSSDPDSPVVIEHKPTDYAALRALLSGDEPTK